MCAHPELNQYIRNVLLTVRSLLLKVTLIRCVCYSLDVCVFLLQNSVKKVVVEISDEVLC